MTIYDEIIRQIDHDHHQSMMTIRTFAANEMLTRGERTMVLKHIVQILETMIVEVKKLI
jgi:hypothetical protein